MLNWLAWGPGFSLGKAELWGGDGERSHPFGFSWKESHHNARHLQPWPPRRYCVDNCFPPSGSWEKHRAEFSTALAFVPLTLQKYSIQEMELPLCWSWVLQTSKPSKKSVLLRYRLGWQQTHFWSLTQTSHKEVWEGSAIAGSPHKS